MVVYIIFIYIFVLSITEVRKFILPSKNSGKAYYDEVCHRSVFSDVVNAMKTFSPFFKIMIDLEIF